MPNVGDHKKCPMCGAKATLVENVDPTTPEMPDRMILVWRCVNQACDYYDIVGPAA
jgi:hypothetical protein